MGKGIESVGDILKGVLEQKGLGRQLRKQGALHAWPEVVGEAIARVTKARSVSGDALVVEVRSSAWLMELNLMRNDILERLNEGREEGRIGRIAFVLAEKPEG
jgi:predicted nucleic acid-binding Zn ribbon protein